MSAHMCYMCHMHTSDLELIPTSAAAALMGCHRTTVERQLEPAMILSNGYKLYSKADALAWTRRRKAGRA